MGGTGRAERWISGPTQRTKQLREFDFARKKALFAQIVEIEEGEVERVRYAPQSSE